MSTTLRHVLFFAGTLVVYEVFRALQLRTKKTWQNPLLFTLIVVGAALRFAHVELADYRAATRPLSWLVAPSVVALGLALDARLDELRQEARAVSVALVTGAVTGALSAVGIARVLGASRLVAASLAPKSATTAIAAPVSERIGGDPSLTAVVVILVGVFGALVGPTVLRLLGVKSKLVFGLSMGAAAHVVGTSRAKEDGPEQEGAAAAAMVLHGILTAAFAWVALRVVGPL